VPVIIAFNCFGIVVEPEDGNKPQSKNSDNGGLRGWLVVKWDEWGIPRSCAV